MHKVSLHLDLAHLLRHHLLQLTERQLNGRDFSIRLTLISISWHTAFARSLELFRALLHVGDHLVESIVLLLQFALQRRHAIV